MSIISSFLSMSLLSVSLVSGACAMEDQEGVPPGEAPAGLVPAAAVLTEAVHERNVSSGKREARDSTPEGASAAGEQTTDGYVITPLMSPNPFVIGPKELFPEKERKTDGSAAAHAGGEVDEDTQKNRDR